MALRALLLSPDDQAIHAITGVLEELSVSCERPMDGASAAKKLNSESFDLVVVDCDNLPAAKLIFDVCRRAQGGVSVPVAIVDGRVGLPTAFRLGAELILTKPVAKDQARVTIRTAVGRAKKEPARDSKPSALDEATAQQAVPASEAPEALAHAAAAGAGPIVAKPAAITTAPIEPILLADARPSMTPEPSAPAPLATSAPVMSAATAASATAVAPPVNAAGSAVAVIAKSSTISEPPSAAGSAKGRISEDRREKLEPRSTPGFAEDAKKSNDEATAKAGIQAQFSDDRREKLEPRSTPGFAEDTKKSNDEATLNAGIQAQVSDDRREELEPRSTPGFAEDAEKSKHQPARKAEKFSSYEAPKKRGHGLLVGALVVAIGAGGFYAGWMYQPGFREFVRVRVNDAKTLLGMQTQPTANPMRQNAAPAPVKPAPQQTQPSPTIPAAPPQAPTRPAAVPDTSSSSTSAPSASGTTTAASSTNAPATAPSLSAENPAATEVQKKNVAPAAPANDLPELRNEVILSSKGAEKRLLHRVNPVISAKTRAQSMEATIVLKAVVDENGAVRAAEPVGSNSAASDAAIKAVKQWRYKPYTRDGKNLPFQTIVLVDIQ